MKLSQIRKGIAVTKNKRFYYVTIKKKELNDKVDEYKIAYEIFNLKIKGNYEIEK